MSRGRESRRLQGRGKSDPQISSSGALRWYRWRLSILTPGPLVSSCGEESAGYHKLVKSVMVGGAVAARYNYRNYTAEEASIKDPPLWPKLKYLYPICPFCLHFNCHRLSGLQAFLCRTGRLQGRSEPWFNPSLRAARRFILRITAISSQSPVFRLEVS